MLHTTPHTTQHSDVLTFRRLFLLSIRGYLLVVAADALAAVDLLGRQKGFGPKLKSICWSCNASGCSHRTANNFLNQNNAAPKFVLRNHTMWCVQIALIAGSWPQLHEQLTRRVRA